MGQTCFILVCSFLPILSSLKQNAPMALCAWVMCLITAAQAQQPGGFPRQSGPGQLGHGQAPAQQYMPGQGSSPKIDPSQIPRPADRVTSRETAEFDTRHDGHHAVPPSAQVRCLLSAKSLGEYGPQ